MELSERLERVLNEVDQASCLIDVGCDHGFLSIEAVRRGKVERAVCSDVRKGPLERAKEHIERAGLQEKIQTRLADGLRGLTDGCSCLNESLQGLVSEESLQPKKEQTNYAQEDTIIVIAGMGGLLLSRILTEAFREENNIIHSAQRVIIQPQSEWETVRKTVDTMGFIPTSEQFFYDRGKPYWIMNLQKKERLPQEEVARFSYEKPWQFMYGRLLPEARDSVLLDYINHQLGKKKDPVQKRVK